MAEKELVLETIIKGCNPKITNQTNRIIKERKEWGQLIDTLYGELTNMMLFAADFNDEMVLASFSGEHDKGGYDIEIERAVETDDAVDVYVKKRDYQGITTALKRAPICPFHIVKTKKSEKEVVFHYE
ncbi:protease complex subunit PrcB family protein [Candidatus Woesearchaeota archaeon]|nr:protease complex subunit PrcB family protein [Candidatus Woesearchaeota archaeon]